MKIINYMKKIEKRNAKKRVGGLADLITVAAAAFFVLLLGTLIFILPGKKVLERENRPAASFPRFSARKLVSGEFIDGVADFYDDRLPFREELVSLRSVSELILGGGCCGEILVAADGYLIDYPRYSEENYRLIQKNINDFLALGETSGLDHTVAVIPRGIDVMKCKLSGLLRDRDAAWELLRDGTLTFDAMLSAHAEKGEYVWYRTDHHYTTLGAYYVYLDLSKTLGYEPYPMEFFTPVTVSGDFLGTSFSSSGLPTASADEITLFRYGGDGDFTVTYGNTVQKGFYELSRLEGHDKYSVFLGGNHGLTEIKKEDESRPTLIMIKDSYSHAIAPFLALHFDLELIDPRYYKGEISELISSSRAEKMILFCGIDTLADADLRINGILSMEQR